MFCIAQKIFQLVNYLALVHNTLELRYYRLCSNETQRLYEMLYNDHFIEVYLLIGYKRVKLLMAGTSPNLPADAVPFKQHGEKFGVSFSKKFLDWIERGTASLNIERVRTANACLNAIEHKLPFANVSSDDSRLQLLRIPQSNSYEILESGEIATAPYRMTIDYHREKFGYNVKIETFQQTEFGLSVSRIFTFDAATGKSLLYDKQLKTAAEYSRSGTLLNISVLLGGTISNARREADQATLFCTNKEKAIVNYQSASMVWRELPIAVGKRHVNFPDASGVKAVFVLKSLEIGDDKLACSFAQGNLHLNSDLDAYEVTFQGSLFQDVKRMFKQLITEQSLDNMKSGNFTDEQVQSFDALAQSINQIAFTLTSGEMTFEEMNTYPEVDHSND